jgi:Ser/Thr protein kinase RdoA (MazF antagonist)
MPAKNLPVTESTLSALYLKNFLGEMYELGSATTCKLFRTGINHLYIVTDNNSKFVFRVYTLGWRTKLEISEEIRLLNHLLTNNVRIAYPITDKNGNYIQDLNAPEGIRHGVLFSFARGKKIPQFNEATSFSIGCTMARMHQVTENFALKRVTYDAKILLENSYNISKTFFTKDTEQMIFVENATKYLIEEYKKVNQDEVRYGAIHLDIWFDNLHVNGEDEITLFDFDFCGNGWLCYDIAYYMLQLYNTRQSDDAYQKKLESFIKGYESIQEITGEEKRVIPMIAVSIWFFYLGVQCDRFDNWSNVFLSEDYLKRFVGIIKKWIEYHNYKIDASS